MEKVTTTCSLCGVGCTYDLNVKDGKVVGVTLIRDSIVNGSSICVKGRYHTDFAYSPDRITTPLIKKDGEFVEAGWDEALDFAVRKLQEDKRRKRFGRNSGTEFCTLYKRRKLSIPKNDESCIRYKQCGSLCQNMTCSYSCRSCSYIRKRSYDKLNWRNRG